MVAIAKGCTITNKGRAIIVKKNSLKIKFDEEIKTKMVSYAELCWQLSQPCIAHLLWLLWPIAIG